MAGEVGLPRDRKILVAVDESEESMHALSWCLENVLFCGDYKDTLILLYAIPPRAVYPTLDNTGHVFSSDFLGHDAESIIRMRLILLYRRLKECVKVETRIEHGDPRDVICEMAEKLHVDVVVMGSHGYGLIKRAFLGSVSNHCVQNVKCPVLVVKRPRPDDYRSK
ncbi:ADENINE NUCLEOTIDE ALPHA HYDROLASES-LIKE SUPERFAMILY PROTEIN [Salix koriyanagi]|uniref:ADENINE NUCLEOTIDE ALPHA HYDROLASES-LIKE SUPERFAMILY PROTEIN n=1 Tax=Salix koriyanagi TaxID=2511006 RepID=A0A9Q0P7M6_9ROSI|nr:ADENINE NUCLEOTIDE ALPHA HYDROLASES-LIKE SUPERFAMILY PROTEIN [Salix koriyanagi]